MLVIGHILPIALAAALSTVPITATIVLLLSPGRSRSAAPFLIGWVLGMFLTVSLTSLAAQAIPVGRTPRQADTALGVVAIMVGISLIVLAIVSWRRARRMPAQLPKWVSSIGTLGPWKALGVAFVLNLRPKGLLLAIAAGLTIRADSDSLGNAVFAIVVYTVIGASTVAGPIIATLAAPARMEPRLLRAQGWLGAHGEVLTDLILIFIGVVVIGAGIGWL